MKKLLLLTLIVALAFSLAGGALAAVNGGNGGPPCPSEKENCFMTGGGNFIGFPAGGPTCALYPPVKVTHGFELHGLFDCDCVTGPVRPCSFDGFDPCRFVCNIISDDPEFRPCEKPGFLCPTCNLPKPNNLQVNWKDNYGKESKFHLTELKCAHCAKCDKGCAPAPPDAAFNTLIGCGTGRYNGVDGATVLFVLKDCGEPGADDEVAMAIWDKTGKLVLWVPCGTELDGGNHQAHK